MRIEPKRSGLPSFLVRWDQGDNTVDVDLIGDAEEARRFAVQKPGYRGHKTVKVSETPRTHAIDIETPATGPVFNGTIALNVDLGVVLGDGFTMSDTIEVRTPVVSNDES